ncbi:hypothetical protein CsatA_029059 [Cannabis sativa]
MKLAPANAVWRPRAHFGSRPSLCRFVKVFSFLFFFFFLFFFVFFVFFFFNLTPTSHRSTTTTPRPALHSSSATLLRPKTTVAAVTSQSQPFSFNKNYSISDKDLNSRGFILRCTPSDLNLDNLNKVFVAVGFPKRDTDNIRIALENTDALLWIEYEKTQRPVAFARATGDRVFNAIIWDVVVDPSFQGFSLGKAVMERLIDQLLEKGITNIALYSEPRVLGFYKPMGFVADLDGIRGMVYSRKNKKK